MRYSIILLSIVEIGDPDQKMEGSFFCCDSGDAELDLIRERYHTTAAERRQTALPLVLSRWETNHLHYTREKRTY